MKLGHIFYAIFAPCFCVIVLTGCKEEIPIGPIKTYEGSRIGVPIEKFVEGQITEDETYLYAGHILVGIVRDYTPGNYYNVEEAYRSMFQTELFYDLESRIVFEMKSTLKVGFFEGDCRHYGELFQTDMQDAYDGVSVVLRSPAHGSVIVLPEVNGYESGSLKQNYIIGECPIGYRLTPHLPTNYEVTFTNGYLKNKYFFSLLERLPEN